ncbi:conjugative transposon protein TraM [Niabella terrae]
METRIEVSDANHRMRKLWLLLPLLVLPFLILLLWALGLVGSGSEVSADPSLASGINLDLPAAVASADSSWNKLSYYEQAEKEAHRLEMQLRNDSSYNAHPDVEDNLAGVHMSEADYAGQNFSARPISGAAGNRSVDKNEAAIFQKLRLLQQQLDDQSQEPKNYYPLEEPNPIDMESSEYLPEPVNASAVDSEIGKLDQMLDKIITIQHPEKISQALQIKSEAASGAAFPVQTNAEKVSLTMLQPVADTLRTTGNGFFSLNQHPERDFERREIRAAIHETQTIVNGATVKLRLTDDIFINNRLIPKESFVYGLATLSGERLRIAIKSIRMGASLFPVDLSVYDMDGIEGIRVPGSISKRVAGQSAERGLQGMGLTTVSPSVGIQAAGLGIEAARSFLGKKLKLVRVTLKAGYRVLLKDEKRKG